MKRFRQPARRVAIEPGIEFMPASKNYRVCLYRGGKNHSRTLPDLAAARLYRAELEAQFPSQRRGPKPQTLNELKLMTTLP